MKDILVVCEQTNIDTPLRRSLAHLVNSCNIAMASNGYQALAELKEKVFNLIIIDSDVTGIDGLELVESIEYIDPGVPIIFMLPQAHKSLWGAARRLKANPILRPFKALTFLRLIDTLLHEHLERYRELAETLKSILTGLSVPTQAPVAFLIDGTGQMLISTSEMNDTLLADLSQLANSKAKSNGRVYPLTPQQESLLAPSPQESNYTLYLTSVIENLRLGIIFSTTISHLTSNDIWQWVDATAKDVESAFYKTIQSETAETTAPVKMSGSQNSTHIAIPLMLDDAFVPEPDIEHAPIVTTEQSTDQQIIPDTPLLLSRLEAFCQIS